MHLMLAGRTGCMPDGVKPADMEFCLLGPLLVRRGGATVDIPPGRLRALLAVLLLAANRPLSVDRLIETLWESAPPASAKAALQNHIKRMRKSLADAEHRRISTAPHGYMISLGPGELDLDRFEILLASARAAARGRSWQQAAGQARAALSLWRGDPLSDVACDALASREVPRLAELRLQALEARVVADLHLDRHQEVIAELQAVAAAEPLRERLHELLMLALYRDGRQAAALAAYRSARGKLVEELGIEPGPGLRELNERILRCDPRLLLATPAPASHQRARQPPATASPRRCARR